MNFNVFGQSGIITTSYNKYRVDSILCLLEIPVHILSESLKRQWYVLLAFISVQTGQYYGAVSDFASPEQFLDGHAEPRSLYETLDVNRGVDNFGVIPPDFSDQGETVKKDSLGEE
jgi:hypothetical protein